MSSKAIPGPDSFRLDPKSKVERRHVHKTDRPILNAPGRGERLRSSPPNRGYRRNPWR